MASSQQTVLVTGVAGIGAGFVQLQLEKGNKVFAVDRRQEVLDQLPSDNKGLLTKITADVGTEEGLLKIKETVKEVPINQVLCAAAVAPNDGEKPAPNLGLANLTHKALTDAIQTDVHGKVFLVKVLLSNLIAGFKTSGRKSRVFNLGAPFGDGPKPDGSFVVLPGWMTIGVSKAASKYAWESLKLELSQDPEGAKAAVLLGYGHPGLTESSITKDVKDFYPEGHILKKMVGGRLDAGDCHSGYESACLFSGVMEEAGDEEFEKETWGIAKIWGRKFGGCEGVKETSDVKGGLVIPSGGK